MYNHILYFSYWVIDSIVLLVFNLLFPSSVVLGNWRFNSIESAIYAGFWVTFFIWTLWDFAIAKKLKFDSKLVTLGYFWIVTSFSYWLVSRFSQIAGFGIKNYLMAFLIAAVALFFQRIAWSFIVKHLPYTHKKHSKDTKN